MGRNFSSGLLAGVVAAVIWTDIGLWQGVATETVGVWGLVFLVGTTVVATIIAAAVASGRDAGARTR
jgi:hypothetical protein